MPSAVKFEVLITVGNSEKPKECSKWETKYWMKFVKLTAWLWVESLHKLKVLSIGENVVNPQTLLSQGEIRTQGTQYRGNSW